MATRAFVFDMDGTMVDSMPFHARSWAEFAKRHDVAMPVDEILRRTTGRNGVECIRELFGADLPEERALRLIGEKEAIYRELFAPHFREVAGLREFMHAAQRRGMKVAVATAGDRHNIAFTLERLALAQAPDVVIGGDEGLPGKPEPALFLESARRLGIAPAGCVVFEDAPFGIEAARRAGMRAVALCTTHRPDELAGAHVVAQARDFQELMRSQFLETLDA
jgi:beta-phosphoglucomutase-like phosphatase (HAD superfamily)